MNNMTMQTLLIPQDERVVRQIMNEAARIAEPRTLHSHLHAPLMVIPAVAMSAFNIISYTVRGVENALSHLLSLELYELFSDLAVDGIAVCQSALFVAFSTYFFVIGFFCPGYVFSSSFFVPSEDQLLADITTLNGRVTLLERENEELVTDNDVYAGDIDFLGKHTDDLTTKNNALRKKNEELEEEIFALNEEVFQEHKTLVLRNSVRNSLASSSSSQLSSEDEKTNTQWKQQVESMLERIRQALESSKEETADLGFELTSLDDVERKASGSGSGREGDNNSLMHTQHNLERLQESFQKALNNSIPQIVVSEMRIGEGTLNIPLDLLKIDDVNKFVEDLLNATKEKGKETPSKSEGNASPESAGAKPQDALRENDHDNKASEAGGILTKMYEKVVGRDSYLVSITRSIAQMVKMFATEGTHISKVLKYRYVLDQTVSKLKEMNYDLDQEIQELEKLAGHEGSTGFYKLTLLLLYSLKDTNTMDLDARSQYQNFLGLLRNALASDEYLKNKDIKAVGPNNNDKVSHYIQLLKDLCYIRFAEVDIFTYLKEEVELIAGSVQNEGSPPLNLANLYERFKVLNQRLDNAPLDLSKSQAARAGQKLQGAANIMFDPTFFQNTPFRRCIQTYTNSESGQQREVWSMRHGTPTREQNPASSGLAHIIQLIGQEPSTGSVDIAPDYCAHIERAADNNETILHFIHESHMPGNELPRVLAKEDLSNQYANYLSVSFPMDGDFFTKKNEYGKVTTFQEHKTNLYNLIFPREKDSRSPIYFPAAIREKEGFQNDVERLINEVHEIFFDKRKDIVTLTGEGENAVETKEEYQAFLLLFCVHLKFYLEIKHNVKMTKSICKDDIDRGNVSKTIEELYKLMMMGEESNPDRLEEVLINFLAPPFLVKKQGVLENRHLFLQYCLNVFNKMSDVQKDKLRNHSVDGWKVTSINIPKIEGQGVYPLMSQAQNKDEYDWAILKAFEGGRKSLGSASDAEITKDAAHASGGIAHDFESKFSEEDENAFENKKNLQKTLQSKLENGMTFQINNTPSTSSNDFIRLLENHELTDTHIIAILSYLTDEVNLESEKWLKNIFDNTYLSIKAKNANPPARYSFSLDGQTWKLHAEKEYILEMLSKTEEPASFLYATLMVETALSASGKTHECNLTSWAPFKKEIKKRESLILKDD